MILDFGEIHSVSVQVNISIGPEARCTIIDIDIVLEKSRSADLQFIWVGDHYNVLLNFEMETFLKSS